MEDKSQNSDHLAQYVRTEEVPMKPPPVLETGVLKWVRENLFSSIMNSILTVVGFIVIVYSIVGTLSWSIGEGNWHSVLYNLRFFMLGRFEAQYEWRIPVLMFFSCFALGAALAVWIKKIARIMLLASILIGIVVVAIPFAINRTVPLPSSYMLAGNIPVVQRSTSEMPIEQIAFTGQAGDNISIRIAEDLEEETALAGMAGFIDRASNTLRNSAAERLDGIARYDFLVETLNNNDASTVPFLTANQWDAFTSERDAFSEIPEIAVTYALNQNPVLISILDADTMEAIREPLELSAGEIFSVTLEETGWYILQKTYVPSAELAQGLTLLDVRGIYPILQSSGFDAEERRFVDEFIRMTDDFRLRAPLPQIDGANARFVNINENKFFGLRSFGDYLSAYLAPFLNAIGIPIISYLVLGIIGYWFIVLVERYAGKNRATMLAALLLVIQPIVFWILVNGVFAYTALMWLLVVALVLLLIFVYQIGRHFGTGLLPYSIALIAYFAFVFILMTTQGYSFGGYLETIGNLLQNPGDGALWLQIEIVDYLRFVPLIIEPAALPRFLLWFAVVPLIFAAWTGIRARIVGNENRYYVGILIAAVVFYLLAAALLYGNPIIGSIGDVALPITLQSVWPLQPSSANDWGGLLLVMAITIYGIIIAFPIGVALALGRRSDLPIIKTFCIGYIELVRGSPFITVLFFVQLLLPLLNPELNQLANTYRAIIATIAFSAAYLAENVRGGLQSLPPGQSEAAKALGLSAWQMTILITLPQALRAVIPALVGQFIGLFKDTSLVSIVGLIDLVKVVDSLNAQPAFSSTRLEGLLFISVIYFVFSYVMAYVSRLLEASGSGATRRM